MTRPVVYRGPRASRVMKARRESLCALCLRPVRPGAYIGKIPAGWSHVDCILAEIRKAAT